MSAKDKNKLTISSKARCERYRGHAVAQQKIKCYGLKPSHILRLTFTTKEEFDEHFKEFCCGNFGACPYRTTEAEENSVN